MILVIFTLCVETPILGAQNFFCHFWPFFWLKSIWYTCGTGGVLMKRPEGAFLAEKTRKNWHFLPKNWQKKKKIKKIKGGFFSSWGFTNKKMKKFFFFFSGPWDHFFGQKMAIFWRKIKFMTKKSTKYGSETHSNTPKW